MPIPRRPPSATNNLINALGVAAFFAAFFLCRAWGTQGLYATLAMIGAYGGIISLLEVLWLRTPWRPSAGLDFTRRDESFERFYTKLLGIYGSFGFVALLYWLFPEYHGSYYSPYWAMLKVTLPSVLALAVIYTLFTDARMREPRDGYYWLGRCLLLRGRGVSRRLIGPHLLGWVVKGFFLPLMFISINGNIGRLLEIQSTPATFPEFFRAAVPLLFTLDLLAAVTGYILTLRLLDTHIRSAEPTMLGWWACLICYQPFQAVFMSNYFAYDGGDYDWIGMLAASPFMQTAWGAVALALLAAYTAASLNFGCRFSNLTHRGILTGGMYRFTKHPAYIAKNLFWWMTSMPFIPRASAVEAVRFCVLLLGINLVYYLRARTEERHLSRDPVYVEYALWMNEHGLLRRLGKCFPFLRYASPPDWEKLKNPYGGLGKQD